MFGMPSDEDRLRELLQKPEIQQRVKHLGRLPFTDILQIMSAAQAFLMPNIPVEGDMEGFGLVCLEANLCGLPVFAANLEGITDAIQDQHNGWLLPTQQQEVWVKALERLQENPEAVRQFGVEARAYVLAHFGWAKMSEAYFRHFESLVKF